MATRPTPYVKKDPGDIMLAADWNEMQVQGREALRGHRHTGGDDAEPITRAGIAPGAVDGSRIDPNADVALKSLKVNGRAVLDEIDALMASFKALPGNNLTLAKDLQVNGTARLGAVAVNGPLNVNGAVGVVGDLNVRAGAIRLSLAGNGGGSLVLVNNANDNRVYLEAFNGAMNGHAAEMLLTGANSGPVPQITLVSDRTVATGAVHAGNSDIYFTRTDHVHTGFGNTAGYAAIENCSHWDALMLLGRADVKHPTKANAKVRMVKLWDYLEVNGDLRVIGPAMEVNGAGGERCYLGGDGAGNDVQVGSLNPTVVNVAMWNWASGPMALFAKSFNQNSDLALKRDVSPLGDALKSVLALRGVRYNLKAEVQAEDAGPPPQHIGFIAQDVQPVVPEAVTESRGLLSVSYTSIVPLLVEAIKEQQAMIDELRKASAKTSRTSAK